MASRYAPGMTQPLVHPPKAQPGDRIAVVSPSFAAPGFAPAVHEQAMRRLAEVTGLVPVEYPTTRQLGASAEDRARDLNAAFADPQIRAVIATVGGEDQITVIGHLDADAVRADPKPFLGYSDNTEAYGVSFRFSFSWIGTKPRAVQPEHGARPLQCRFLRECDPVRAAPRSLQDRIRTSGPKRCVCP